MQYHSTRDSQKKFYEYRLYPNGLIYNTAGECIMSLEKADFEKYHNKPSALDKFVRDIVAKRKIN